MKKLAIIFAVTISIIIGIIVGAHTHTADNLTYTVDRIEEGQNGEQWAVVEVYNSDTDEINMIEILVEEGYTVR